MDLELQFQTEIINIKSMILKIKDLGIDMSKIECIVNELENGNIKNENNVIMNIDNEESYSKYYNNKLQIILELKNTLIEKYNNYVEIYGYLLSIESNLDNIDKNNIEITINLMNIVLDKIKVSNSIYFDKKKELLEKTYQLAYQLIKIELIFYNSSKLLTNISKSNFDMIHIEKYLLDDLASLEENKDKYSSIFYEVSQIKRKGLDNYLNINLLHLLKYVNHEDLLEKKKNEINKLYKNIENKNMYISKLEEENTYLDKEIGNNLTNIDNYRKKLAKYSGFFVGYLSFIIVSLLGTSSLIKKLFTDEVYLNTKQIYYVNNDELSVKTSYNKNTYNKVIIKEYFPYDKLEQQHRVGYNFRRDIYNYDVSNFSYEQLIDYTTIDFALYGIEPTITNDWAKILPYDDLYQENQVFIEKTIVDTSDYKKEVNDKWKILAFSSDIIMLLGELYFLKKKGLNYYFKHYYSAIVSRKEDLYKLCSTFDDNYNELEIEKKEVDVLLNNLYSELILLSDEMIEDDNLIKIKKKFNNPNK